MEALTVEATARVLGRFGITFTEGGVRSLVQRELLKTVPRLTSHIIRNSKYNYAIEVKSLVTYLRNKGISDSDIKDALDM
jgi:hypothetical protein